MRSRKKIIATILAIAMFFTCIPASVSEESHARGSNDLQEKKVQLEENGEITEGVSSNITELIPEEIPEYPVNLGNDYEIQFDSPFQTYPWTGNPVKPSFKLINNSDPQQPKYVLDKAYKVSYDNNVEIGTATVKIEGLEEFNYYGTIQSEFEIVPGDISQAEVTIPSHSYQYSGKAIKPEVTVKYQKRLLIKDTDYVVKYHDNLYPGTAGIEIKGIGKMQGVSLYNFKIDLPFCKMTKITTAGHGMNKVYWEKVKGVSGYLVYRSTSKDGKYTCLRNADPSYSSWVDKKCTVGKTYYYKMRCYRDINGKRYFGKYTNPMAKDTLLTAPSSIKVRSRSYNSISIYWTKVEDADGYVVYRSTNKKTGYKRVRTIEGYNKVSCANTKLKTGTRYFYKVAAYKNSPTNPGLFSEVAYTTPHVETVEYDTKRTKKYKTSVNLNWHSVEGASGYDIFKYNPEKKKYYHIKYTPANVTYWSDKNLDATKKYYYKVRAYRIVDGVKKFGYFSDYYKKAPNGWVYTKNYKLYYSKNGNLIKDVRKIIGKQSSYVIKVNKKQNVVTVYAKDGQNGYIIPVVAFRCSTGKPTPIGTFYTPGKYRWHELMGPSWGQWNTRIHQGFLFHSVYYMEENDNKSLPVNTYNRLGQTESHGCVRLRAGDAKWIYDNCSLGTKVIIYNSDYPGPFGKPSHEKLPYWHTWDPTDPTAYKYCRAYHCHGK